MHINQKILERDFIEKFFQYLEKKLPDVRKVPIPDHIQNFVAFVAVENFTKSVSSINDLG